MIDFMQKRRDEFKNEGFWLATITIFFKIINKIYSFFIMGRKDIHINLSAKIIGRKSIAIGRNFYAGRHLWLEAVPKHGMSTYSPKIVIKNDVSMNDFVHIAATNYVEIGNSVLIASKVYISDHNHGYYTGDIQSSPLEPPNKRIVSSNQKVIIHDNVWIGEGVCILPGVEIGQGSIIAANAVVTKNIPEFSIAAGIPAKVIKQYDFQIKKWIMI